MTTAKKERAITFEHAADMGSVTFKSGNGDSFTLKIGNLSVEAAANALVFGVARKVVNAAALDAGATVAEKWAGVLEVATRLDSGGTWNGAAGVRGAGGEGGLVVEALMRVYGDTREKAEATVARTMEKKGLDRKAALKLWASTDKVGTAIAEIKAERAKKAAAGASVDADSLLDELS